MMTSRAASPATPLVSVLVTAHNREQYIAASLESVLAQTFTDFELIVVDDASTDATADVARRFERDSRVRVVVNQRNLGQFPNRNFAATLARGALVKYHDSDDVMYPHCLEVLVRSLEWAPDAAFALTAHRHWVGVAVPARSTPRATYRRHYLGNGVFGQGPGNALFRADALRRLGGFPDLGVHSDAVFFMRACRAETIVLAPTDLYWYRVHPEQALASAAAVRDEFAVLPQFWFALDEADCPLDRDERAQARRRLAYAWLRDSLLDAAHGRWRAAAGRLRAAPLRWYDWIRYARRTATVAPCADDAPAPSTVAR
jgi:glycosyltransferase involved in cell wall biosynthesis